MPILKKPLIRPVLNASTAHITKKDDDLLKREDNPLSPYRYEFGYFIHVGEDLGERKAALEYGHSETLLDLVDEARDRGCHYLQLDCDGEEYPELPTYEW
jgi:hypothetical protein